MKSKASIRANSGAPFPEAAVFWLIAVMRCRPLPASGFFYRFPQQIFDMGVDAAKFVGGPFFQRAVQLGIQSEGKSFFFAAHFGYPS